jgi:D-aminopeptidase
VAELGNIETPIILTNTLSVSAAVKTVVQYTLQQPGNEDVQSVNAVAGETNDGWLNDIRGRRYNRQKKIIYRREIQGPALALFVLALKVA